MDRSNKSRLVLAGIVLGVVLLGFAVDYSFFRERRRLNIASVNAQRVTASIAEKIGEVILSYEAIANEASFSINHSDTALLNIQDLLADVVDYNDNVYGCGVILFQDSLANKITLNLQYCNKENGRENYYNVTQKENISAYYEIKSLVEKEPLLLDETMALMDKSVGACYFTPIFAKNAVSEKECAGLLGLELKKDWFISFIESVATINKDHMFLVNSKGNFLYYPRKGSIKGNNLFEVAKNYKSPELAEVGRRMLRGETGFVRYTPLFRKEKFLLFFTPVPKVKCYVGILFPENELLK